MEQDWPAIVAWWDDPAQAPQPAILPEIGILAETETGIVAAAWLYQDISGRVAMIEWEYMNPEARKKDAVEGLRRIYDFIETYAVDNKIGAILTWVLPGTGIQRLLVRRKWMKCPGERHEMMAFVSNPKEATCP